MGKKVDVKQVAAFAEVACNGVSDSLRSVALVRGIDIEYRFELVEPTENK